MGILKDKMLDAMIIVVCRKHRDYLPDGSQATGEVLYGATGYL